MRLTASNREAGVKESMLQLGQESLQALLIVITLSAWLWAAGIMLFVQDHTVHAWLVFGVVLGAAWVSNAMRRQHWRWAVGVFAAGLIVAASAITALFGDRAAPYLFAAIVFVTAILASPNAIMGAAILCAVLIPIVSGWGGLSVADALPASLFTLIAAGAAWLSSQRLHTALSWALTMTHEAQRNAEEAQAHRGEVQRVLKSLDEAYVRLERAHEALIYAREAAERAYRFKAEFVANVSHELRTPLNLIVGFSEMMATAPESYDGIPLPSQYRGDIMAIYRNARHLSDLINDVLDLSRIEAGRMPLVREPANVSEVVHEVADMVRGLISARRLQLELDLEAGLPVFRFDRTRVRQVLLNLLTNATRFTDQGWIRVRARARGGAVEIAVQDSGRGMSPGALGRAFESFVQLDENYTREGSGLGLAVSKKFVELHEGRMWIESDIGRGTTVSFTLPTLEEPAVSVFRAGAPATSSRRRPNVLVLHDDPSSLALLRRHIDECEFALVETEARARAAIQEAAPAAVIVDTAWSGQREDPAGELGLSVCTPLIACPMPSLRRLALVLGAHDYLTKPVSREDLLRALSRLTSAPRTVLIVDDDPHVARLLTRMLRAIDHSMRVLKAFSGREGLLIAQSQRPDLIFLDLCMPEKNGYEFMQALAQDGDMAGTQVIIVSVKGFDEETATLPGDVRIARQGGFTVTEMLGVLRGALAGVTGAVRVGGQPAG